MIAVWLNLNPALQQISISSNLQFLLISSFMKLRLWCFLLSEISEMSLEGWVEAFICFLLSENYFRKLSWSLWFCWIFWLHLWPWYHSYYGLNLLVVDEASFGLLSGRATSNFGSLIWICYSLLFGSILFLYGFQVLRRLSFWCFLLSEISEKSLGDWAEVFICLLISIFFWKLSWSYDFCWVYDCSCCGLLPRGCCGWNDAGLGCWVVGLSSKFGFHIWMCCNLLVGPQIVLGCWADLLFWLVDCFNSLYRIWVILLYRVVDNYLWRM